MKAACTLLLALIAWPVSASMTITAAPERIDLGSVAPGHTSLELTVFITVRAEGDWSVSGSLEPDEQQPLYTIRERVEARAINAPWTALPPGVRTPLCSGNAAAPFPVQLRVRAGGDALPGERHLVLRLGPLVDGPVVRLTYVVENYTRLSVDPRAFASPAVDPGRPGVYPYEAHRYVVTSNVPWRVEVAIGSPKSKGPEELPSQALVIVAVDGTATPLVIDQPTVIAQGGPTGSEGVAVDLRLGVRVDARGLAGGEYVAPLNVFARAESEQNAALVQAARR
jgi:hypothetical protein